MTYEECGCFTEERVSIAITTHKVQKYGRKGCLEISSRARSGRHFGLLSIASQACWVERSMFIRRSTSKVSYKAALSEQHSWPHTVPRGAGGHGQEEGSRWASSSPVSQSSAHGGACHVLPLFSCSCGDSKDRLTSEREEAQ